MSSFKVVSASDSAIKVPRFPTPLSNPFLDGKGVAKLDKIVVMGSSPGSYNIKKVAIVGAGMKALFRHFPYQIIKIAYDQHRSKWSSSGKVSSSGKGVRINRYL